MRAETPITCHVVDFVALPPLPPVDEVYLALGTTTLLENVVSRLWQGIRLEHP